MDSMAYNRKKTSCHNIVRMGYLGVSRNIRTWVSMS